MEKTITKLSPLALAGLLFLNVGYYYDLIMVPAYNMYYEAYAAYPEALVNFGATGPQILVFFGTLLCTFLLTKLSKKTILVIAFGLFTVCGCALNLTDDFYFFLVMRSLIGLAAGGLLPVAVALIAEVYHDRPAKVSFYTGIYNGVGAVAGAIMTLVAGFLCVGAWRDIFACYWVSIPILIMLILFVPKTPPDSKQEVEAAEKSTNWSKGPIVATCAAMFAMSIFYVISVVFLSYYVTETELGDPSITGIYSSIMTIGSALGGFTFPAVYKFLGRKASLVIYGATTVGYALLFIHGNIITPGVGTTLAGYAYTFSISYYMVHVTKVVPAHMQGQAITIVSAALALGAFACSYVYTAAVGITGTTPGTLMPWVSVASACGLVLSFVAIGMYNKRAPLDSDGEDELPAGSEIEAPQDSLS